MSDKKLALPVNGRDYADPDGVRRQQRVFEESADTRTQGKYDGVNNTDPSTAGLIAHDRGATVDETSQNQRPTAVSGDDNKIALDVALSDSSGNRIDENNPLATYVAESPADEVHEHDRAVDVATDGSSPHDYTVTAGKTFKSIRAKVSSSAEARFSLLIETAVASDTFTEVDVVFGTVASPNSELHYGKTVAAGVKVRVQKTNLDNQANDLYSTILGLEI